MKVVEVTWVDACLESGWSKINPHPKPEVCHTVGYVVGETPDLLSLAGTVSDDEANGVMTIPKAWIRKRRVIRK